MQQAMEQEAEPDEKTMNGYFLCVITALVERLGGNVTITPRELYRASKLDSIWEQDGTNYSIHNIDLCPP